MINASKEFKEKIREGANVVNYADVTLSNGTVLHLEPKDFMIGGCTIEDKTTDGKFGVGFVIGKTLTIRLANYDERFSHYDFYNSIIYLYVALLLDDGSIEKIRKGVYFTTVPETPGDIIETSAVDGMFKLDKDYSNSTTRYPATLQTILTDACLDCGIPIGFRQFDNMNFIVDKRPEKATYRQVVSYVCQIAGYNARIDNDGYMQLIWYNSELLSWYNYNGGNFKTYPHDTVIDGGNFKDYSTNLIISGGSFTDEMPEHIYQIKNLDVHTDNVQITGVRVIGEEGEDGVTALFGEEGYVIEVKGNPFVIGKESLVADHLGKRIVGITFRPFSTQILNNPLYEPFEIVRVSDRKGNVYVSLLNSISYTIGGYTQVACESEDPVRNGSMYYSEAAAAVVESRRNAEKQITEYDKAVQNMNQLVANSMGLYFEKEMQPDGSAISYESNKPITVDENGKCHFEPGSTVWMKSDNGFFISNDGGKPGTFESGWDKNGNVVVNVLYAIGIVADWIKSGRFEVKKGNKTVFLADVDTGEVCITPDFFELSSGETIESISKKQAQNVVNGQTQEDIANKLTNNGQSQGIYLEDGNIYVNGAYIRSWEIVLGGANNKSGRERVLDATGKEIGRWDNDGIYVDGGEIYCKTETTGVSIFGGQMHLTHGNTDVGYIGTYAYRDFPSNKGLLFDLNSDGSYMAWASKEGVNDSYVARLLYANKTFSSYTKGKLYAACNMDFMNYEIQNAYINGLKVRNSFNIPNNVDCDIYSNVDFHNFEIRNAKIYTVAGVNGYKPYTGNIHFISNIQSNSNGGITWTRASATVSDGYIMSVSSSAQS